MQLRVHIVTPIPPFALLSSGYVEKSDGPLIGRAVFEKLEKSNDILEEAEKELTSEGRYLYLDEALLKKMLLYSQYIASKIDMVICDTNKKRNTDE